jgi:hypothetical protein
MTQNERAREQWFANRDRLIEEILKQAPALTHWEALRLAERHLGSAPKDDAKRRRKRARKQAAVANTKIAGKKGTTLAQNVPRRDTKD